VSTQENCVVCGRRESDTVLDLTLHLNYEHTTSYLQAVEYKRSFEVLHGFIVHSLPYGKQQQQESKSLLINKASIIEQ
jgi:hypothetical protein